MASIVDKQLAIGGQIEVAVVIHVGPSGRITQVVAAGQATKAHVGGHVGVIPIAVVAIKPVSIPRVDSRNKQIQIAVIVVVGHGARSIRFLPIGVIESLLELEGGTGVAGIAHE